MTTTTTTGAVDGTVGRGVRLHHASAVRGGRSLWNDLDLGAPPGTMTAIVGPSGTGKSTLLQCIGQLDRPDSGEVWVCGRPTANARSRERRRMRRDLIGYLFQDGGLVEETTVLDNLELVSPGRRLRRVRAARIDEVLASVGLAGRQQAHVHALSGGERQRLAVARLLLKRPAVVLADEPTASLDAENERRVIALLRSLAEDGSTVIVATHAPTVAAACDRVVQLGADGATAGLVRGDS